LIGKARLKADSIKLFYIMLAIIFNRADTLYEDYSGSSNQI